jgi:integration host factor subunit beta
MPSGIEKIKYNMRNDKSMAPKKPSLKNLSKSASATTTKKKLIHSISQEKGIHPNDVRHVIQAFLDKMTECLREGDRLEFRDFGVFEVVQRKQKIGRNPKKADEPIIIPARFAVKFTPGKKMRELVEQTK